MVRLNFLLLLVVVLCALSVVTSQHKARKLFQALEGEQERSKQLEVEFGQLQLELSTWATSPRIEKIARDKLRMKTPEAAKIITINPVELPRRAGEAASVKHGGELSR
ncbi:MAG: cell division protein FtsL [Propionivibrio sp.]|uniref:cell division protein FtsL n=1 Tax=Propionivibrio sp. TaxID=2212460 RepID=UPI001A4FA904|nr:cell division protein FtsL [Propionivibrio sp.]MBL8413006.1 cell division protein FtsL [Propionivibrio sp.]